MLQGFAMYHMDDYAGEHTVMLMLGPHSPVVTSMCIASFTPAVWSVSPQFESNLDLAPVRQWKVSLQVLLIVSN